MKPPRFADLGLPGGDMVDERLTDLASGRTSAASLLVSLAAPRLRREGVPVTNTQPDPELQLYRLLSFTEATWTSTPTTMRCSATSSASRTRSI
ncbi:MAG: hypothetical protein OXC31_29605 [Spirochaetaceae bacterium]|nr:hypothetical protein [Spirochaetaceae bacterium]